MISTSSPVIPSVSLPTTLSNTTTSPQPTTTIVTRDIITTEKTTIISTTKITSTTRGLYKEPETETSTTLKRCRPPVTPPAWANLLLNIGKVALSSKRKE